MAKDGEDEFAWMEDEPELGTTRDFVSVAAPPQFDWLGDMREHYSPAAQPVAGKTVETELKAQSSFVYPKKTPMHDVSEDDHPPPVKSAPVEDNAAVVSDDVLSLKAELEKELKRYKSLNHLQEKALNEAKIEAHKYEKLLATFNQEKDQVREDLLKEQQDELRKIKRDRRALEKEQRAAIEKSKELAALKQELKEAQEANEAEKKKQRFVSERLKRTNTQLLQKVQLLEDRVKELEEKNKELEKSAFSYHLKESSFAFTDQQIPSVYVKGGNASSSSSSSNMMHSHSVKEKKKTRENEKAKRVEGREEEEKHVSYARPMQDVGEEIDFTSHESDMHFNPMDKNEGDENQNQNQNEEDADVDVDEIAWENTGPDGRRLVHFVSGKRVLYFVDGTRKISFPDGSSLVEFANGDTHKTYPDGVKVYFYGQTGTKQTTFMDGMEVFEFASGQVEKHYSNGKKEVIYPDNVYTTIYPDGKEETVYPDGKKDVK